MTSDTTPVPENSNAGAHPHPDPSAEEQLEEYQIVEPPEPAAAGDEPEGDGRSPGPAADTE